MDVIEKHTVSIHFVNSALRHLDAEARTRVLNLVGVADALLESPNARVPANTFSALWLAVALELDDEFFGLDRRPMKVGSFALLSQAAVSCPNLERALKRILRGLSLFLDDVKSQIRIDGVEVVVSVSTQNADEADRRFADETTLILIHGLMCWLAGRRINLSRVEFGFERPTYADEYTLMYCNDIRFNAAQTCMRLLFEDLKAPVVQTAENLPSFLRAAPQSVFLKYRNEDGWSARVRKRLRASAGGPETWPVFSDLAAELDTSPTTLRRRLTEEGGSYQSIKDQLRNDLAVDHLCNSAMSVDDIGASLGFHDASAFHRAFKRWNGIQPGEYRRRQYGK